MSSCRVSRQLAADHAGRLSGAIKVDWPRAFQQGPERRAPLRGLPTLLVDGEAREGLLQIEALQAVSQRPARPGRASPGSPPPDPPTLSPPPHDPHHPRDPAPPTPPNPTPPPP